jgi:hypothetical protein
MYKNRGTCIPHLKLPKKFQKKNGGPDQDRTDDLLNANQALSQLSYGPTLSSENWWAWQDLNLRPHAYQACALTN